MGGNAVDAAVAVSLALGASEPGESGLGGSTVMLIVPRDRGPLVIHSPPENVTSGSTSFLRPSTLPVLVHAWRRHGSGRIAWEELVAPAREVAERGYPLGYFRQRIMVREYRRLLSDPVAAALLLHPDRSLPGEGVQVALPELATTLEQLAETNPDDLPGGAYAAFLQADLAELVDSAAARALATPGEVREDAPLGGSYRGWTVLTPGEPYQGARLLRALEFLQAAPVDVLRTASEARTAWLAEALGFAGNPPGTAPTAYLAGTPPLPLAVTDSVSLRRPIRRAPAPARPSATEPSSPPGGPAVETTPPPAAGDTTRTRDETSHFSIVDADGLAVSVTQSLGGPFGARATRLGFFLARPLPPAAPPVQPVDSSAADTAAVRRLPTASRPFDPWAEPPSWLLPTVLVRDSVAGLVLGSPGGPRALSAIVQAISLWVDGGQPIADAIAAPRVHVEPPLTGRRPRLALEGVVWTDSLMSSPAALAPWGGRVRELALARSMPFAEWDVGIQYLGMSAFYGGVNAVAREEGAWVAAADPRRDGVGRPLTDADVLRAQQGFEEEAEEAPPLPPSRPPRQESR
jgi:gamma-glutamyltranspeptidase/glutathione hydrolase